jgi:DNA-binding CsgD family transcriptional regulator
MLDDVVATDLERARCRERLERLSESSLDCDSLRREALRELQRVIGFDRWCWALADPDSLIPLGGIAEHDYGPAVPRELELEYSGDDFAAMDVLARRVKPAASLSIETGGDLARSPRWDQVLRPVGIGDEAVVACRDVLGCWGWLKAYRDSADARFAEHDLDLLAQLGPALGTALRHHPPANDGGAAAPTAAPTVPGVIVLGGDLSVLMSTASARAWLEALPSAGVYAAFGILPAMVYPAATLSRSADTASRAHALERCVDGRWVMIEAAALEGRADGEVAVTFRAATGSETFDRLCRIYALSGRERDVVAGLLDGLDTRALSERLFISRHTVQDHLKSVFEKTRVHSRRELLAKFSGTLA